MAGAVDQNSNCIIDDAQILKLVQLWVTGENVCSSAGDKRPQVLDLDISPNPALTSDSTHDIYNYFDLIIQVSDPQRDVNQALTRIEQSGYTGWFAYGENIAVGMEAPEAAFEAWRNSPPHN